MNAQVVLHSRVRPRPEEEPAASARAAFQATEGLQTSSVGYLVLLKVDIDVGTVYVVLPVSIEMLGPPCVDSGSSTVIIGLMAGVWCL